MLWSNMDLILKRAVNHLQYKSARDEVRRLSFAFCLCSSGQGSVSDRNVCEHACWVACMEASKELKGEAHFFFFFI